MGDYNMGLQERSIANFWNVDIVHHLVLHSRLFTHKYSYTDDTNANVTHSHTRHGIFIQPPQSWKFDLTNVFILAVEMGRCYLAESSARWWSTGVWTALYRQFLSRALKTEELPPKISWYTGPCAEGLVFLRHHHSPTVDSDFHFL